MDTALPFLSWEQLILPLTVGVFSGIFSLRMRTASEAMDGTSFLSELAIMFVKFNSIKLTSLFRWAKISKNFGQCGKILT